jgi:hypothetical protein
VAFSFPSRFYSRNGEIKKAQSQLELTNAELKDPGQINFGQLFILWAGEELKVVKKNGMVPG